MQAAKLKLTEKVNEKGEPIFEIGEIVEIKREDYRAKEEKLTTFKLFLKRVTEVGASQLTKKFSSLRVV